MTARVQFERDFGYILTLKDAGNREGIIWKIKVKHTGDPDWAAWTVLHAHMDARTEHVPDEGSVTIQGVISSEEEEEDGGEAP